MNFVKRVRSPWIQKKEMERAVEGKKKKKKTKTRKS